VQKEEGKKRATTLERGEIFSPKPGEAGKEQCYVPSQDRRGVLSEEKRALKALLRFSKTQENRGAVSEVPFCYPKRE